MTLHVCPYPGCDARLSPTLFLCWRHRFAIPVTLLATIEVSHLRRGLTVPNELRDEALHAMREDSEHHATATS